MEGSLSNNLPKHGISVLTNEINLSQTDCLTPKMGTDFRNRSSKEVVYDDRCDAQMEINREAGTVHSPRYLTMT